LNFNYKLIKYYKLVDLSNNKIKINCFNRLAHMRLQNSAKNNKFSSKQKVNIFFNKQQREIAKANLCLAIFFI